MLKAVTTLTPHRISFAGGGTDMPNFYRENEGCVLNTTINKYLYVTVKKHSEIFEEKYRICYSKTEQTNSIDEIENGIARECLKLLNIEYPLYISTVSDIPSSTGLGSSSSFAVGLLYALHALNGESVSAGQLAEEACEIEINCLKHPIGKQDQYAAAYGGLNCFKFRKNDITEIEHIIPPDNGIENIFNSLMLFWTGFRKESSHKILNEQNSCLNKKIDTLSSISSMVDECKSIFLTKEFNPKDLGEILHRGWIKKKMLAKSITNEKLNSYYDLALSKGSYGGKIAGAGGGGFLLLACDQDKKENIRKTLSHLLHLPISYEPRGSRILHQLNY